MGRKGKRRKAGGNKEPGGEADPPQAAGSSEAQASREALTWVLHRLNVLEYLILFLSAILALIGGALVAWVLNSSAGLSFRWSWAIGSLLLFILPGGFVYLREFRGGETASPGGPKSKSKPKPKEPHG